MNSATRESLTNDLRSLGVEEGDTLFVHASYKSVGPVEGKAGAIVGALEDALGAEGLLLMPSFNLIKGGMEARAENWNIDTTPSTVGWLTEFFRLMEGTVRSDHYSHSVAGRGKDAAWVISGHLEKTGMTSPWDLEPWGRPYGDQSPMLRVYERPNSKILMLGVDYESSTYQHVAEVMDWHHRLADDPEAECYNYKPREKLGAFWEAHGRFTRGQVGQADCRLFGVRDYVDTLVTEVLRAPADYCHWHPDNHV